MGYMKTKTTVVAALLFTACAWRSFAQPSFDSTGDGKLTGSYYMRQVLYVVADQAGDLGNAITLQGEITFNGAGNYSFTGNILDASASTFPTPQPLTTSGAYAISQSGEGFINAVIGAYDSTYASDQVIGLVSQGGVFIGSSTENNTGYNDLFIAAPIGSTPADNGSLNGNYTVAYFDPTFCIPVSNGTCTGIAGGDALFTISANGSGNIGTVNVTEYLGDNTSSSSQTLSNVAYSFTNGAAQISFGGNPNNSLIAGTEVLYISPDNRFIFGGSANGFDIFAGVLAASSNPSTYDTLYYQAGADLDNAEVASAGYSLLDTYFGSLQAASTQSCGTAEPNCFVGHQRVNSPLVYQGSSDFTYYDAYKLNGDGSSDDVQFGQHYVSSSDGTIRIGYGIGPQLGLNVAFQAPSFSGSGVYISPVGVVNAASSSPFTAFLSPGEFLTLYGSDLAPATNVASVPFPNELGGVQVFINQVAAPIYYVSPSQVSVIVPYITTPGSVAQIQIVNNGQTSNMVTQFTGMSSAGAFTNSPVGGIGIAAAERPDYSIVSESNPAQIGDTIALYLAGMGAVSNQPADGTAAPSSPLAETTSTPTIILYDANGNCPTDSNGNCVLPSVTFSGLAPGFAGLYQIDFTIPSGYASGNGSIEIEGPDSDTFEALLPIGAATSSDKPAARAESDHARGHFHHHRSSSNRLKSKEQTTRVIRRVPTS